MEIAIFVVEQESNEIEVIYLLPIASLGIAVCWENTVRVCAIRSLGREGVGMGGGEGYSAGATMFFHNRF